MNTSHDCFFINFIQTQLKLNKLLIKNNVTHFLSKKSNIEIHVLVIILVILIGIPDYLIGHGISLSLFYTIPVAISTWCISTRSGYLTSFISAIVSIFSYIEIPMIIQNGEIIHMHHPYIIYVNGILCYGMLSVITFLIDCIKERFTFERSLSRIDPTTSILNLRAFTEQFNITIRRSIRLRMPYALAYFDLDNFKLVNDKYSHAEGDRILKLLTSTIKNSIRGTDILARLGGDEFVLLMVDTTYDGACHLLEKIRKDIEKHVLVNHKVPLTCSVGCICVQVNNINNVIPEHNGMLSLADNLMYEVKNTTKNNIIYKIVEI